MENFGRSRSDKIPKRAGAELSQEPEQLASFLFYFTYLLDCFVAYAVTSLLAYMLTYLLGFLFPCKIIYLLTYLLAYFLLTYFLT